MALTLAINGFGRIGRAFLRAFYADPNAKKLLRIAAINLGPMPIDLVDYFFKYDTVMGTFPGSVRYSNGILFINDDAITILTEQNPINIPWHLYAIDYVLECSGKFTKKEQALKHCIAGAKKVLLSAPADDADIMIIPGINDNAYNHARHTFISLGSCTTNCFAPLIHVINKEWTLSSGVMTTIHAYTNDQVIIDGNHHDPRRSRAAALNIIPTKTGADKAIITLFPNLAGKLASSALRVPVASGSLVDFSFTTVEQLSVPRINEIFAHYATTSLASVLAYATQPLVSSDYTGNTHAAIFDSLLTQSTGTLSKIFAWYDNEYGYASRMLAFLKNNVHSK